MRCHKLFWKGTVSHILIFWSFWSWWGSFNPSDGLCIFITLGKLRVHILAWFCLFYLTQFLSMLYFLFYYLYNLNCNMTVNIHGFNTWKFSKSYSIHWNVKTKIVFHIEDFNIIFISLQTQLWLKQQEKRFFSCLLKIDFKQRQPAICLTLLTTLENTWD